MMTAEDNLALVTRFYLAGVNRRDWAVVEALLAPNFSLNGQPRGVAGQCRALESLYAAFRDARVTLAETLAADDLVVCRVIWSGLHSGAFRGIPATGKRVTWSAIAIVRVADGKIVAAWVNEDTLGLLQQLGARVEPPRR
jgi:steroid delta-isomerase-like uncharacterized protein